MQLRPIKLRLILATWLVKPDYRLKNMRESIHFTDYSVVKSFRFPSIA